MRGNCELLITLSPLVEWYNSQLSNISSQVPVADIATFGGYGDFSCLGGGTNLISTHYQSFPISSVLIS